MSRPPKRCAAPSTRRSRPIFSSAPRRSPTGGQSRRAPEKLKKAAGATHALTLVENPDILAAIGRRKRDRPALVVGFAAETEALIEHAQEKRLAKGCDLIVANSVGAGANVFGGERNEVTLIAADGLERWPSLSKKEVAARLVARLAMKLNEART